MYYPTRIILLLIVCGIVIFLYVESWGQDTLKQSVDLQDNIQHVLDSWALEGAFSVVTTEPKSFYDMVFRGPSLYITRLNPDGIGFNFGITYIMPTGFYNTTGPSADIALFYGYSSSQKTIFLIKVGLVGFACGNSDGGLAASIAAYPGIGIVQHLVGPLAVSAEVSMRFWYGYDGELQPFGARLGLLLSL